MNLQVAWSIDADLLNIWGYLFRASRAAVADEQLNRLLAAASRLSMWPQSGRSRDNVIPGMRSSVVSPYLVFYRLTEDEVQIVRVLYGSRDIDAVFGDT